jgi:tetratricopeptide (TPR) repeat protein
MMRNLSVSVIGLLLFSVACGLHKEAPSAAMSAKSLEYYLSEASYFLKKGEAEKAISQLNEALAQNPKSSKVHNLFGIAYFQKKDYELAKSEYQKALEIDPSYAQAYNNLGCTHFMMQELDQAAEMFRKALSLSPNLVSALFSLGTLLASQGDIEGSTLYFSKGIALDPEFLDRETALIANLSFESFKNPEIFFTFAKIFAAAGNVEKTVFYLEKAKLAGFQDWGRIEREKEFENVKNDERIKNFLLRLSPAGSLLLFDW